MPKTEGEGKVEKLVKVAAFLMCGLTWPKDCWKQGHRVHLFDERSILGYTPFALGGCKADGQTAGPGQGTSMSAGNSA